MQSLERALTTKARKHIKKTNFALPGEKAYPIHDISHARNALARVAQHGNPSEKKRVKAAVYKKYPSLKPESAREASLSDCEPISGKESLPLSPKRTKFQETGRISEQIDPKKLEGHIVDVVLVTEGLGNKRDKNYYGPEAIKSAVEVFEGTSAFLNHPTESDSVDIPERRIEDKCGYYKNLREEQIKDQKTGKAVNGVVGELHLDLSESGQCAFEKFKTAIHYRAEFPNSSREYVGLSVNADGDAEPRTMTIEGEELEVNYVNKFIADAHTSCDVVTSPARGGRVLALVEDEAGAIKSREARMKIRESIASALAALKLVASETDAAVRAKKLAEANKVLKEAEDETAEADILGIEAFSRQDGESEADHKERLMGLAKGLKKQMDAYRSAEGEDEEEDEAEDGADDDDDDGDNGKPQEKDLEAARYAIKHLLHEAKIPGDVYNEDDIRALSRLPLKVAKRRIAREARLAESIAKRTSERLGMGTFVLRESSGGSRSDMNAVFKECFERRH